jgi:hypothetical protein
MKKSFTAHARPWGQHLAGAHGFYFATAGAALAGALATGTVPAGLALVAAAWWIAAVHELGHAAAALVAGMRVPKCWATPGFGRTTVVHGNRTAAFGAVAVMGPLAGLGAALGVHAFATSATFGPGLGAAGVRWLGLLAWLGMVESVVNLLPLHPRLDGHVAVRCLRRAGCAWVKSRSISSARPAVVMHEHATGLATKGRWMVQLDRTKRAVVHAAPGSCVSRPLFVRYSPRYRCMTPA